MAQTADIVIYFGGIDLSVESEGLDRTSIALPGIQLELIQELEKVARSPIHIVMMSGGGLDLTYIRDSDRCGSLIWMGYAGQSGGLGLATVMFGQFNPAARLPITIYPASYVNEVSMLDMQMRPSPTNPGRTYKFYTGQPVFEFGYGLSYTSFAYSWYNSSIVSRFAIENLMNNHHSDRKAILQSYRVNVTNTGALPGDDVVLAYIVPPRQSNYDQSPPIKKLFGFQRVHLNVGESTQVVFPLNIDTLLAVAQDGSKWLEPGVHKIMIGQEILYTVQLEGKPVRWSSFER